MYREIGNSTIDFTQLCQFNGLSSLHVKIGAVIISATIS